MKNHVNIAVVGYGVVGSGTLQLLKEHRSEIESRVGAKIQVRWICSRHIKKSSLIDKSIRQTTNWKRVISDPEVDCVVELMGGENPARQLVLAALKSGKHVVTANKAILSKHWNEIFNTANDQRKLVYFEAAVGGGVPIVQALNEGLAGNKITKIVGILNGTTNFILTKMQESGIGFDDALKEAQAAGFAEADPSFDINGIDAAQKISILGSLATGQWISPSHVYTEGIGHLQTTDLRLIQEKFHSTIKLLSLAEKTNSGWTFRVHPSLVPRAHPFANVRDEYNAILVHGNAVEDVMLYGKGAGKFPTSSAVLSDIIFLCRQIANGTAGRLPYVNRPLQKKIKVTGISHIRCRYYLRVTTVDKPGVLSTITGILGRHGVSLASVHQDTFEGPSSNKGVPIVLLTHETLESSIQDSVRAINRLQTTEAKTVLLRMA
jgi:homoserine dehydrogenase